MQIEREIKVGTCTVKIGDGHVHLQQLDPITSAKHWIAISEEDFRNLVLFGNEYFTNRVRP